MQGIAFYKINCIRNKMYLKECNKFKLSVTHRKNRIKNSCGGMRKSANNKWIFPVFTERIRG